MRKQLIAGALVTLACGLTVGFLLLPDDVSGQTPSRGQPSPLGRVGQLLPPAIPGPNLVPLSPIEQAGKFMIFDTTLSDPPGYACFQCHHPAAGGTGPSSANNAISGTTPGVVPGRFDNRKPLSYTYAVFSPIGPTFDAALGVWLGGNFWDGRVTDLAGQAEQPPLNPNEMANIPTNGIFPPLVGGFSALLVQKLQTRPYTPFLLSPDVWGPNVFQNFTPEQIYFLFAIACATYEASGEICQFSSRWDASRFGTPPQNLYTLSASEERGRILYGVGPNATNDPLFGQAQCFACHSSLGNPSLGFSTQGKDTFTMYCYANIGVPRNTNNPFYSMFGNQPGGCTTNPFGCNPLGASFVDPGLAGNPNPAPDGVGGTGTVFNVPGPTNGFNITQFMGLFKAPSTRNSDLRPTPNFVKAYFHNGFAKSLEQVVHFYNTRNLTTQPGEVIDFTQPNPYANLVGTPLWPMPEVNVNLQNAVGLTPQQAAAMGVSGVTATNGQVGNLGLTPQQEADVVAFLRILSDGFTAPNPITFP